AEPSALNVSPFAGKIVAAPLVLAGQPRLFVGADLPAEFLEEGAQARLESLLELAGSLSTDPEPQAEIAQGGGMLGDEALGEDDAVPRAQGGHHLGQPGGHRVLEL